MPNKLLLTEKIIIANCIQANYNKYCGSTMDISTSPLVAYSLGVPAYL
jgi:hypothetical protein